MKSVILDYIGQLEPTLKRRYQRRPMIESLSALEHTRAEVLNVETIDMKGQILHIALKVRSEPLTPLPIFFYGYCILPTPKGSNYYFEDETVRSWLKHAVKLLLNNKEDVIHIGYDTQGVVPLDTYGFIKNFKTYLSKLVLSPRKALRVRSYYLKIRKQGQKQEGATISTLREVMGFAIYRAESMDQMMEKVNTNHLKRHK